MAGMNGKVESVERYGRVIFENQLTDPLRKVECLCLNCTRLKTGPGEESCPMAQAFFKICVDNGIALMVTRCPVFDDKTPPKAPPHYVWVGHN
jgi:hypothetical protein